MNEVGIVGGGIGGMATAIALAQLGQRVRVLEKAPSFGELGAGIQIAPNAARALDRLGVLADVERHAVFPQQILWMDARSGEPHTALELGSPFVERYGYRYMVMHRSDLLDVLIAHARADARITLEARKEVAALEDRGDRVHLTCTDGTVYEPDLLIGADGLWSMVRRTIADDGDPVCSAYVAYRGTIPIADVSAHAGLDNVMLWTGHNRHLVQYPIRRGELYNQVAVFRSLVYTPDATEWGTPAELDAAFAKGPPLVQTALTMIKRDRRWPMFDRAPLKTWTRNRMTLIGDAAHPMLQYLAQGACQALEDAVSLAGHLAAYDQVETALAEYERERLPRTARVQTTARAWGDYWHLPTAASVQRNALLAARSATDYAETDWLYSAVEAPLKRSSFAQTFRK